MKINFLHRKRKGQVRAIDFTVSLLLFLIMLSQILLILFNIRFSMSNENIYSIGSDDIDSIHNKLFNTEGSGNWGYLNSIPSEFGLKRVNIKSGLYIDQAKLSHLIPEIQLSTQFSSSYISYDILKGMINLDSGFEFNIAIKTLLNVEINVSNTNEVTIGVFNDKNEPSVLCQISYFSVRLIDSHITLEGSTHSDSTGKISFILDNEITTQDEDYIIIGIARKGKIWGIGSGFKDNLDNEILFIGENSNIDLWCGSSNNSNILISDTIATQGGLDNHSLSIIYPNSTNGYIMDKRVFGTAVGVADENFLIPNEDLVVIISSGYYQENGIDKYNIRIASYPTLFSNSEDFGIFGESTNNKIEIGTFVKSYPIIIRGLLHKCYLTGWRDF